MYDANKEFDVVFRYTSADFDDLNPLDPDFTICPGPCLLLSHAQGEFDGCCFFSYFNPQIL